jgi:predicted 3-demethylubiquinone-9 3-methyltransferase (glyoxalase superfamily)
MQKITPMLWFDDQAEEAAGHYIDVFSKRPGSDRGECRVVSVSRYNEAGPGPAGTAMVVEFELDSQRLTALNGGKQGFEFSRRSPSS